MFIILIVRSHLLHKKMYIIMYILLTQHFSIYGRLDTIIFILRYYVMQRSPFKVFLAYSFLRCLGKILTYILYRGILMLSFKGEKLFKTLHISKYMSKYDITKTVALN